MNKREVYKKRMALLKNDLSSKYTNQRFVQHRLQADGTVLIDVVLPSETELFDPMAPAEYGKLNPEIYNYIDEQAYFVPSEYNITVRFSGRKLSAQQQKQVDAAIHEHYNLQVYDKVDDIRRNRRLGIFLLVFGAIALAAYFFLTLYYNQDVFLEIVSIVGTFSVWEAVDCWLIQGHERKVELNNALQMATLKTEFVSPSADNAGKRKQQA